MHAVDDWAYQLVIKGGVDGLSPGGVNLFQGSSPPLRGGWINPRPWLSGGGEQLLHISYAGRHCAQHGEKLITIINYLNVGLIRCSCQRT